MQPPRHLTKYVRSFWFIEGARAYTHHAFAYTCPELVFAYQGSFTHATNGQESRVFTSGIFGQTDTVSRVTLSDQPFGIMGVYLYPHTFFQLFGIPATEYTNQHTDLASLAGQAGAILEEQIMLAKSHEQRVDILSTFLTRRLSYVRPEHNTMASSITAIIQDCDVTSVRAMADDHCLSVRQFERRFKLLAGFSPRLFFRIARFNAVLNPSRFDHSLSEVAHACGYYDQSHFIHDFQQFSGFTPKAYFNDEVIPASNRGTVEFVR